MISRSASRMLLRMLASVLPRQSVSPVISPSIRSDAFIGSPTVSPRAARLRERHPLTGLELDAALEQLERRARLIDELEELQILSSDGAVVDQGVEVDHFLPERGAVEKHRNRAVELVGVRQREAHEQLVARAAAAGTRSHA